MFSSLLLTHRDSGIYIDDVNLDPDTNPNNNINNYDYYDNDLLSYNSNPNYDYQSYDFETRNPNSQNTENSHYNPNQYTNLNTETQDNYYHGQYYQHYLSNYDAYEDYDQFLYTLPMLNQETMCVKQEAPLFHPEVNLNINYSYSYPEGGESVDEVIDNNNNNKLTDYAIDDPDYIENTTPVVSEIILNRKRKRKKRKKRENTESKDQTTTSNLGDSTSTENIFKQPTTNSKEFCRSEKSYMIGNEFSHLKTNTHKNCQLDQKKLYWNGVAGQSYVQVCNRFTYLLLPEIVTRHCAFNKSDHEIVNSSSNNVNTSNSSLANSANSTIASSEYTAVWGNRQVDDFRYHCPEFPIVDAGEKACQFINTDNMNKYQEYFDKHSLASIFNMTNPERTHDLLKTSFLTLSIISLIIACIILTAFKKLRSEKNKIHVQLFLAFILRATCIILNDYAIELPAHWILPQAATYSVCQEYMSKFMIEQENRNLTEFYLQQRYEFFTQHLGSVHYSRIIYEFLAINQKFGALYDYELDTLRTEG